MSLPSGISTCVVTFGRATSYLGNDATITGTLSADRAVVHAESGVRIGPGEDVLPNEAGLLSFSVPHVDQEGMVGSNGGPIEGWLYVLSGTIRYPSGKVESYRKTFQVLVGQAEVDLDLVGDGPLVPTFTAPIKTVTSVNGLTGVVVIDGINGAVDSVNDQTGVVVLDAADVGADPAGSATTAAAAAQAAAIAAAATDATTKANAAQAAAGTYTDIAVSGEAVARATAISTAINALIASAPGLLDTLDELAAALGDDPNFAATMTTALAGKQPVDADLTAIAALSTTTFGRSLLALADAAAGRTALGLGSAATQASTTFDAAGSAAAAQAASQPVDTDLTAIAALTTTAYGRALLTLADAAAARTALALGTAATANTGTTSGTVPLLSTGGVLPIARLATGTPDGTKFVRDDGTLAAAGGAFKSGPAYASGLYYAVPSGGAMATIGGYTLYTPFVVDRAITIDRIGAEITTAAAGQTLRLGLYADNNGKPGAVVLDAGTIDAATTGIKEVTTSTALPPGRYWSHFGPSSAAVAWRANTNNLNHVGYTTASVAMGYGIGCFTAAISAAALTANPATSNGPEQTSRLLLRVA